MASSSTSPILANREVVVPKTMRPDTAEAFPNAPIVCPPCGARGGGARAGPRSLRLFVLVLGLVLRCAGGLATEAAKPWLNPGSSGAAHSKPFLSCTIHAKHEKPCLINFLA